MFALLKSHEPRDANKTGVVGEAKFEVENSNVA